MTKQEYLRAKELGAQARRSGHKADRNPFRGGSVHELAQAWLAGWNEVNAERKR